MRIIKQYFLDEDSGRKRCVIRTNTYTHTVAHFNMLAAEIKKDFPQLPESEFDVVHYAGERINQIFGIEFNIIGDAPEDYVKVSYPERTH
jgi:hypothetical protein